MGHAHLPRRGAEILIEQEGPGHLRNATLFLQPHYQLEGLTVMMRLTIHLPDEGRA